MLHVLFTTRNLHRKNNSHAACRPSAITFRNARIYGECAPFSCKNVTVFAILHGFEALSQCAMGYCKNHAKNFS